MIGVDPGGRWTGIVARSTNARDGRPLYAAVITRSDDEDLSLYLLEVLDTVAKARAMDRGPTAGQVAIEDVNAPTGWKNGEHEPINLVGLLGCAVTLGAVLGRWPNAYLVPPGGHGSAPLRLYPPDLIGPREKVGTGYRRHARSAWDVAGVALVHPDPRKADPGKVGTSHQPEGPRHD